MHTNMTNMQKYAPTLLMVPLCFAAANWCGSDLDGCNTSGSQEAVAPSVAEVVAPSVAEAMEAGFSQHLTKINLICSPSLSCACTYTLSTTGY